MTALHLYKWARAGSKSLSDDGGCRSMQAAMHRLSKHNVISDIMEKSVDLLDFEKRQIVMARRLGTSISETAHLVYHSCSVIVIT